jgi:hypothetical protein
MPSNPEVGGNLCTIIRAGEHRGAALPKRARDGGARRSRTDDILLAKQALYQLSYGPVPTGTVRSPGELSATCRQIQHQAGRPGQTRTADLTLIRRTL